MSTLTVRPRVNHVKPFAALPHEIGTDPRYKPVDKAVLLALTFFARDKASCWPCDATVARMVGRCRGTVQRSLARLQGLKDGPPGQIRGRPRGAAGGLAISRVVVSGSRHGEISLVLG